MWTSLPLSKLGTLSRGKSKHRPRNDPKLFGGEYPFIQTSDVKHASFYVNSFSETYNETGLKQSKLWPKNTLCMTIAANIAETALLSFPACFPDSVVGFNEDPEKSDIKFIKYALDYYKKQYQKRSQGAAQDNLSLEKIESLKLNVPPVLLQKKIADIIFSYDRLIEINEKRIKILEEMAQRLYTEWFIKFKFPGHEKVKMVDSFLGKIPEGWEVVPMSEMANFVNGYPFKPAELGNSGLPIVKIPELRSGILDKTPRNNGESIPKKYLIKNGDILFSWSATLLVNIWNSGDALLNQHLFKVEPKNKTQKSYVFFVLKKLVENLSKHVVGATMQHLRRGTIVDSKILLPSPTILENYEDLASTYIQEVGNLQMQNQVLQKTRDLLIPQLVTGKRELKN